MVINFPGRLEQKWLSQAATAHALQSRRHCGREILGSDYLRAIVAAKTLTDSCDLPPQREGNLNVDRAPGKKCQLWLFVQMARNDPSPVDDCPASSPEEEGAELLLNPREMVTFRRGVCV